MKTDKDFRLMVSGPAYGKSWESTRRIVEKAKEFLENSGGNKIIIDVKGSDVEQIKTLASELVNYILQHEQEDFKDWCFAEELDEDTELKNPESRHIYVTACQLFDLLEMGNESK